TRKRIKRPVVELFRRVKKTVGHQSFVLANRITGLIHPFVGEQCLSPINYFVSGIVYIGIYMVLELVDAALPTQYHLIAIVLCFSGIYGGDLTAWNAIQSGDGAECR